MSALVKKMVGQRIKTLRTARGLNGTQLAESIGHHRTAVYHLENGDAAPSIETMTRIAIALRIDELDLLTFPDTHVRHAIIDLMRDAPVSVLAETKRFLEERLAEHGRERRVRSRHE
jgi:transcriptional regulator with XRE-family HTH domain